MAAAALTSSASGHVHRWTDAGVKEPDWGQDSRLGSHDSTLQRWLPLHLPATDSDWDADGQML